MEQSVKIIKNLLGEFVTADVVKEATQKEYNQREWNNTVDRYSKYDEVRFFKTPGIIYDFNYYVIYITDGIRLLNEVAYSSCLSSGSFSYGFFIEGFKDKELASKLKELDSELYKDLDKDKLTILENSDGRISTHDKAREYMRTETKSLMTRFFTKLF